MKLIKTSIFSVLAVIVLSGCTNQSTNQPKDKGSKSDASNVKVNADKQNVSFQKLLPFENISFDIRTEGDGSIKKLFIHPSGLKEKNQDIEMEIDGMVKDAQVADLNSDQYPELLIFTQSAGSGSYGKLVAFSVNHGKSMSQVYFPPVDEDPVLKKGYMGHDKFLIEDNILVLEFPLYKPGDPNSNPTGGIRRVEYKLVEGEASRKFEPGKISETPSK